MAKRGPLASSAQAKVDLGARQIRCAVYTRKSTEEGLDQAFNSLEAQREACAAYVVSQHLEGWNLLPDLYDDGGYSGGTMERPAMKRLLADVESGRIDVIVVYKVDRLTRALSDFAKIVEILDRHGASFVSITQAFNTTTSMGRLTLNVLLSFAQFEREVTGERIRDKIAASKKKGMWMGGPVPLGYDVKDRKLHINAAEAATVRLIFARYGVLGSIQSLAIDLDDRGVRSKIRTMRDGRRVGGTPYAPGALGYLLRNRLYIGEIRHGDQFYAGEHEAILDPASWEAVQDLLEKNILKPRTGQSNALSGLITDAYGRRMASAHAIKGGKRYRYYVSRASADIAEPAWRLPAGDFEEIVRRELKKLVGDPLRISAALGDASIGVPDLSQRCGELASRMDVPTTFPLTLRSLETSINVGQDSLEIDLCSNALTSLVIGRTAKASLGQDRIRWTVPASLRRRGHELRIIYSACDARPVQRDDRLIQLLAAGRAAYEELTGKADKLSSTRRSHLARLARLRFLAPDIISSILDGSQPIELTSRRLLRIGDLPMDWPSQRRTLGFC